MKLKKQQNEGLHFNYLECMIFFHTNVYVSCKPFRDIYWNILKLSLEVPQVMEILRESQSWEST